MNVIDSIILICLIYTIFLTLFPNKDMNEKDRKSCLHSFAGIAILTAINFLSK